MPLFRLLIATVAGAWIAFPSAAQSPALQSLTLSGARVSGCGGSVIGTVTLNKAAGSGGAVVSISGNAAYIDAPESVTIPAGRATSTFPITGKPVTAAQSVTLTAAFGGISKSQTLTIDPAARFPYRVQAIGTLGGSFSEAYGINARGEVVGTADTPGTPPANTYHAYRTDANLNITNLTPALTTDSFGLGINDAGQVVGDRVVTRGVGTLIRVEPDGSWADYSPTSGPDTYGSGINATGQMTGYQYPGGGAARAFRTNAAGALTGLGILSKGTFSMGLAINDSGQVAGMADDATSSRAFRTTATGSLSTATLIGPAYSAAYAINNAGVIAGEVYNAQDGLFHVLRGSSATQWEDLGTLFGFRAQGEGINSRNEIVGALYTRDAASGDMQYRGAILYTDAGGLRDLNELIDPGAGWFLAAASGINDAGQIVGFGRVNGQARAFRLTPVGAPFPYGDANRDGQVNFQDVSTILRIGAGLQAAPDLLAADIAPALPCSAVGYGDGRVDILDAVRLARHLNGLEPVWP